MGIVVLSFQYGRSLEHSPILPHFGVPYLSISVSLNVLLTLMIVVQLVLHGRNIRVATGSPVGIGGWYKAISTMLIESCALFAVSPLVVVVALVRAGNMFKMDIYYSGSYVVNIFYPILAETQVRGFPQPQPPDQSPDMTMDWTGDCSTAHYPTGRQPKRVDESYHHHRTRQFVRGEASGICG